MKAFVFDLDGTLVTCRERQVAVALEALSGEGWPNRLDSRRFWALKRNGATTCEALVRLGVPTAVALLAADRWRATIEDRRWLELDRAFADARQAITAVREQKMSPVILTARRRRSLVHWQIARLRLDSIVDEVVVVRPQHSEEEKARALEKLSAAAFVGDTELDHRSSCAVRVPFAAVSSGQRSRRFLLGRGVCDVHSRVEAATEALLALEIHTRRRT